MESAVMLTAAALSGVHVSLHACGTLSAMLAMSYAKFAADEDLYLPPMKISAGLSIR
jgi:trimethylamine:corrinoid methyltransferase-like protein